LATKLLYALALRAKSPSAATRRSANPTPTICSYGNAVNGVRVSFPYQRPTSKREESHALVRESAASWVGLLRLLDALA
jgi:hypothetical protein